MHGVHYMVPKRCTMFSIIIGPERMREGMCAQRYISRTTPQFWEVTYGMNGNFLWIKHLNSGGAVQIG